MQVTSQEIIEKMESESTENTTDISAEVKELKDWIAAQNERIFSMDQESKQSKADLEEYIKTETKAAREKVKKLEAIILKKDEVIKELRNKGLETHAPTTATEEITLNPPNKEETGLTQLMAETSLSDKPATEVQDKDWRTQGAKPICPICGLTRNTIR